MEKPKSYTITKRIAKHGRQAILVIPRLLEKELSPGTVVRVTLDVMEFTGGENE